MMWLTIGCMILTLIAIGIWVLSLETQIKALRVDHNAVLKLVSGSDDGATLAEIVQHFAKQEYGRRATNMAREPDYMVALREFRDEHPRANG